METKSYIQVGVNLAQRVVKVRVTDSKYADGFLVLALTPEQARALAQAIDETPADTSVVLLSDGKRWAEHELSPSTRRKIATDLRRCAQDAEGN